MRTFFFQTFVCSVPDICPEYFVEHVIYRIVIYVASESVPSNGGYRNILSLSNPSNSRGKLLFLVMLFSCMYHMIECILKGLYSRTFSVSAITSLRLRPTFSYITNLMPASILRMLRKAGSIRGVYSRVLPSLRLPHLQSRVQYQL